MLTFICASQSNTAVLSTMFWSNEGPECLGAMRDQNAGNRQAAWGSRLETMSGREVEELICGSGEEPPRLWEWVRSEEEGQSHKGRSGLNPEGLLEDWSEAHGHRHEKLQALDSSRGAWQTLPMSGEMGLLKQVQKPTYPMQPKWSHTKAGWARAS